MNQYCRYLVVEDEKPWLDNISRELRSYFEDLGFPNRGIVPESAMNGDQGLERLRATPYDLVTLDMNLSVNGGGSKISGLDLLGRIAEGNRAFFVIIITGAFSDPTLGQTYGEEQAALMRYGLLNEAVRLLPAERVRVLLKPPGANPEEAMETLRVHLHSALDQYRAVSLDRNIFRPYPRSESLWEARYNGGPRLTIPRPKNAYELIRSSLSQPNRPLNVVRLMQAIAQSSGNAGAIVPTEAKAIVPRFDAEDDAGLDHDELKELSFHEALPAGNLEKGVGMDTLIGALILARQRKESLETTIAALVKTYGAAPVVNLPYAIRQYMTRPWEAQRTFGDEDIVPALSGLHSVLLPLVEAVKEQEVEGTARVSGRSEARERLNERQTWGRAIDYLEQHSELKELVVFLEKNIARGKGTIEYRPVENSEFPPYWLTQ